MKQIAVLLFLVAGLALAQNVTVDTNTLPTTVNFATGACTVTASTNTWKLTPTNISIPAISGCWTALTLTSSPSTNVFEQSLGDCLSGATFRIEYASTGTTSGTQDGTVTPPNGFTFVVSLTDVPDARKADTVVVTYELTPPSAQLATDAVDQGTLIDGRLTLTVSDEGQSFKLYFQPTLSTGKSVALARNIISRNDAQIVSVEVSYIGISNRASDEVLAWRAVSAQASASSAVSTGPVDPTSATSSSDDDDERQLIIGTSVVGAVGLAVLALAAVVLAVAFIIFVIIIAVIIAAAVVGVVFLGLSLGGAYYGVGPMKDAFGRGKLFSGQDVDVFLDEDDEAFDEDDEDDEDDEESDSDL